jgi:hypothetical protein
MDGAKQVALDAAWAQHERLGHSLRRPALEVTKREDLLLADGQTTEGPPDSVMVFPADR